MLKFLISFIFLILYSPVFSQLNCKSIKNPEKVTIRNCYHKTGQISTIETWNEDKRNGNIKGFNNTGRELFNYSLRNYAGHASVLISYHSNGQVKKLEYSSAPDGGIQFYHYIHEFNQSGDQISYLDLSHWDDMLVLPNLGPDSTSVKKDKKTEVTICAEPWTTVFSIQNETNKKVIIRFKAISNPYIILSDVLLTLAPFENRIVNSLILANMFLSPEQCYTPEIISNSPARKWKTILDQPLVASQRKTYTWYVVRKN